MPFKFAFICDLFTTLDSYHAHDLPLPAALRQKRQQEAIVAWFRRHANLIHASTTDPVALLSCLFPERRTDRVYGIQESTLIRILARCLGLGTERLSRLRAWRTSSSDDLAAHVGKIQSLTDAGTHFGDVTTEDVDRALEKLAARCRFSSPAVRAAHPTAPATHAADILTPIVLRLSSRDLMWFIRILLKRLGRVNLPEQLALQSFHFLLPDILRFHATFDAAIALLRSPDFAFIPPQPDPSSQVALRKLIALKVKPQLGVKVGRPDFLKARSIRHCLQLAEKGVWSVEPKYDGEYVQVHVDLSRGANCIQIFSKSGKDSTKDRKNLHEAIRLSLKLGQSDCPLRHGCILEGEMVVYSDKEKRILDFHKIRKHVSRSGTFLGTERDSPAHAHEHLMIIYYDAFLIDEKVVMYEPYEERRRRLKQLITKYSGWAKTAEWTCLDLSKEKSKLLLEKHMASAIAQRSEGLVLKSCAGPYFSLVPDEQNNTQAAVIKLKKDYIPGLGDSADFAVIGASYNASLALQIGIPKLNWTTFFLACLENKADVFRYDARPVFRNMATVSSATSCISKQDTLDLCAHGRFVAEEYQHNVEPSTFSLHPDSFSTTRSLPDVVFRTPVVVDVLGSSFDKPSARSHYMLRHPRVVKIHIDRPPSEAVGFDELQDLARDALSVPVDVVAEEAEWWRRLHISQRQTTSEESNGLGSEPVVATSSPGHRAGTLAVQKPRRAQQEQDTDDECSSTDSPSSPTRRDACPLAQEGPAVISTELGLEPELEAINSTSSIVHAALLSPSKPTQTRRTRTWPMIRVDSTEMLPGDARFVEAVRYTRGPMASCQDDDETSVGQGEGTAPRDAAVAAQADGAVRENNPTAQAASAVRDKASKAQTADVVQEPDLTAEDAGVVQGNTSRSTSALHATSQSVSAPQHSTTTSLVTPPSSAEMATKKAPERIKRRTGKDTAAENQRTFVQASVVEARQGHQSIKKVSPLKGQKRRRDERVGNSPSRKTRVHDTVSSASPSQRSQRSDTGAPNKPSTLARTIRPTVPSPSSVRPSPQSPLPQASKLRSGPIQNVVIYIPPDLQGWRWLTSHLLSHRTLTLANITTFTNLRHWMRHIDPGLPPLGPEVQESQAYASAQKIVLLDRNMPFEAHSTIAQVAALAFAPTETVEFWDWRVFEDITAALGIWPDEMLARLYDWSSPYAGFSQTIDEAMYRVCVLRYEDYTTYASSAAMKDSSFNGSEYQRERHTSDQSEVLDAATNDKEGILPRPTHRLEWASKRRQKWFGFASPEQGMDWDVRLARHNVSDGSYPLQVHAVHEEMLEGRD